MRVLQHVRMFTGTVISARRDGVGTIHKILWSDDDQEELTAPELGQAMEMHSLLAQLNGKENNK